jgi:hypothetical protein
VDVLQLFVHRSCFLERSQPFFLLSFIMLRPYSRKQVKSPSSPPPPPTGGQKHVGQKTAGPTGKRQAEPVQGGGGGGGRVGESGNLGRGHKSRSHPHIDNAPSEEVPEAVKSSRQKHAT